MGGEAAMVVEEIENLRWWRVDLNLRLKMVLARAQVVHVPSCSISSLLRFSNVRFFSVIR